MSRKRVEFDDLADSLEHPAVVHRLLEVVVNACGLEVHQEIDVDLEGLRDPLLLLVDAVRALEEHVPEQDPVAQVGPPSRPGCQGRARSRRHARRPDIRAHVVDPDHVGAAGDPQRRRRHRRLDALV